MKTVRRVTGIVTIAVTWLVAVAAQEPADDIAYQKDGARTTTQEMKGLRGARFCEIFFIEEKGDQMELNVYNPTGLNNMQETKDSCPDAILKKLDLEGLKGQYRLDAIYFNKPRHWIMDEMKVPVGAVRNLDGLDYYWMASSHMPKDVTFEPGFLTYKKAPVERKTQLTFKAGKPVFLLDDPDGKVWVMKAFRDSYGQTYEGLKDLGGRYKNLPEGYNFRVEILEKDLILRPAKGVATVMQDEFENTFDYLGDGSSNYVPYPRAKKAESAEKAAAAVVPLPKDDAGAKRMKFDGINGQRYTEIFLIGGNPATRELKGGVYNTIGLNDPDGKGDTCPAELLDKVDVKTLAKEYKVLSAYKNGPRLWTLDWVEAITGKERDFEGLKARWVMWLDVPEHLGASQDKMSYRPMSGKRDTHMGINKGTRVYLLDDPDGNTYCMKSASKIIDPGQSYESLKNLGSRLKPAPGWKFRTVVLEKDLVFTPDNGKAVICQDDLGNTYDRVGGPYSNYKP